jgi:dihydroflavonol-4-reductase
MTLVTGGAGFLGTHLVARLVAAGQPVRVLERPGASAVHLPLDRIELVRGDIRDVAAVREHTRGCDWVYHLAADPNLWRRDRSEFDAVNHIGALNVMHAALENGARRVLYTSTESILTSPDSEGGAVEQRRLQQSHMLGPYCLSKFRAEEAAFQLAHGGAPVVVASPTLPVGPGDRNRTPPTRMAVAFCRGGLPAFLECQFNLVDARDAALGMILSDGARASRDPVSVLGGENHRYLSEWLQLLGRGSWADQIPRWKVPYGLALTVGVAERTVG